MRWKRAAPPGKKFLLLEASVTLSISPRNRQADKPHIGHIVKDHFYHFYDLNVIALLELSHLKKSSRDSSLRSE
jgi:hypothetical protein